jgi:hypothetical protein
LTTRCGRDSDGAISTAWTGNPRTCRARWPEGRLGYALRLGGLRRGLVARRRRAAGDNACGDRHQHQAQVPHQTTMTQIVPSRFGPARPTCVRMSVNCFGDVFQPRIPRSSPGRGIIRVGRCTLRRGSAEVSRRIGDADHCGQPGLDVLDAGIGTGIAARQLQASGCRLLGVEVDARMAELARQSGFTVDVSSFENWDPTEESSTPSWPGKPDTGSTRWREQPRRPTCSGLVACWPRSGTSSRRRRGDHGGLSPDTPRLAVQQRNGARQPCLRSDLHEDHRRHSG